MLIASLTVWILLIYSAFGVAFGVWFAASGVTRLDPASGDSGFWFRLFIVPGAAAFWPLLFLRLARGTKKPTEENAHRRAAQ